MKKLFFSSILLCLVFIVQACSSSVSNDNLPVSNDNLPEKTTLLMYIEGTAYEMPEGAPHFFSSYAEREIKPDSLGYTPANYMIKGMVENINEANTNIVVQTGSANNMEFSDGDIRSAGAEVSKFYIKDWNTIKRWQVRKNKLELIENVGESCLGESSGSVSPGGCVSVASPDTIADFIEYGVKNNPADRYIIIFFSHGGGGRFGFGEPAISAAGMKEAFRKAREKTGRDFDIIGFAACLMASAEWMYNLADYARYYVGSEEVEYFFPWLLDDITKSLAAGDSTENIIKTITSSYIKISAMDEPHKEDFSAMKTNISAVDLSKIKSLNDSINDLARKISENFKNSQGETFNNLFVSRAKAEQYGVNSANENFHKDLYDMVDLYNFTEKLAEEILYRQDYTAYAKDIQEKIKGAVIVNENTYWLRNSHGISFYMPFDIFSNTDITTPVSADLVNSRIMEPYREAAGNFGKDYVNMLSEALSWAFDTETSDNLTPQSKDGETIRASLDTNFAPVSVSLDMVKPDHEGKMRAGTVAGIYDIASSDSPSNQENNKLYDISINTGHTEANTARLFCMNKSGAGEYNPIRVRLLQDKYFYDEDGVMFVTSADYIPFGSTEKSSIDIYGIYSLNDEGTDYEAYMLDADYTPDGGVHPDLSFKPGDRIIIPEYTPEAVYKMVGDTMPPYEIVCESSKCIEVSVQSFEAVGEDIEFYLNVKNVKDEDISYRFDLQYLQ